MRSIVTILVGALLLLGGCGYPVYECYFTEHKVGQATNYTGPCKVAPEGKYPTKR